MLPTSKIGHGWGQNVNLFGFLPGLTICRELLPSGLKD